MRLPLVHRRAGPHLRSPLGPRRAVPVPRTRHRDEPLDIADFLASLATAATDEPEPEPEPGPDLADI